MEQLKTAHWTEKSTDDYLYRMASDFVRFIESAMGDRISQAELAKRLDVTEGSVSQFLNNPGNFTLKKAVDYARALGMKVAIVGYNDGDPENRSGPIPAEIFAKSWERIGSPHDFFELESCGAANIDTYIRYNDGTWKIPVVPGKRALTRISATPSTVKSANTGTDIMPFHSFVGTP